jgi:hypothetical protein
VDTRIRTHFKDWGWAAIDERIDKLTQEWWEHELDVLKDAIGGALGEKAAQVRNELKRAIEEMRRAFETKLAEQKERLASSEAALAHERNALIEMTGEMRAQVKQALEQMGGALGGEIAALEGRVKATPGKLPPVKSWKPETVFYAGDVVTCDGSLFQASRDTGQSVTHADWTCLASGGRDGLSVNIRGAFNVYKKYARLDVVEHDGASYVARRDNPGICPGGDGWQLLSRSGRRGTTGERGPQGKKGERGARGEAAPTIVSWAIDRAHYSAVPTLSNGTQGAALELRGLFEQYMLETS